LLTAGDRPSLAEAAINNLLPRDSKSGIKQVHIPGQGQQRMMCSKAGVLILVLPWSGSRGTADGSPTDSQPPQLQTPNPAHIYLSKPLHVILPPVKPLRIPSLTSDAFRSLSFSSSSSATPTIKHEVLVHLCDIFACQLQLGHLYLPKHQALEDCSRRKCILLSVI
jgi:hypothetical protein